MWFSMGLIESECDDVLVKQMHSKIPVFFNSTKVQFRKYKQMSGATLRNVKVQRVAYQSLSLYFCKQDFEKP